MKIKTLSLLLISVILFTNCNTKKVALTPQLVLQKKFQAVLDSIYQARPNAVGIMAHVESFSKKLSWSGAAGTSDKKNPIAADQPALIASNTKTYVSAAILRLVEKRKLKLTDPIAMHLSENTKKVLAKDKYDLDKITIAHLMSHTSGVFDYVNANDGLLLKRAVEQPKYRWTRDEQIALAVSGGEPLGGPGVVFSYADTNYSLLSEVIEQKTGKPFYTSIRELLSYERFSLDNTWFESLEEYPENTKPLVHQYWDARKFDSYVLDHSFDLYGGGGIAATTKDLARFFQLLFNGKLFDSPKTLALIYTPMPADQDDGKNYHLGIMESETNGYKTFGHGGFWGTTVQYFPELDMSISVFINNRDE
ncbi:MAG: serine hydrolase domain-containing protein, partial [Saprospiraceae bacterium]